MSYEHIVVYCGSHFGNDPAYAAFAGELGEALGKNHFHMIYGGGTVGLMGICADAAMAAGGKVTGVIPEVFIAKEQAHRGLTELIEVPDMTIRKQKMISLGDAFLILPGGIGTLEELADTANQRHIYGDPLAQPPSSSATLSIFTMVSSDRSTPGRKPASSKEKTGKISTLHRHWKMSWGCWEPGIRD